MTSVNTIGMLSDNDGNLTYDGTRGLTYDSANRLMAMVSSTLSYDPLDRLTEMVGTLGARYLYDGDEITGELTSPTGTTLNARFVRGPWPNEQMAYQGADDSLTNYSRQHTQGLIIAIADGLGSAMHRLAYDEYGQPRAGNAERLMYTG